MTQSAAAVSPAALEEQPIDPGYLERGTQLGFYKIISRIGAGGMGATYRAERDDRVYALKIATYNLEALDASERRQEELRVNREVAALKALDHPNIVRIHACDMWPSIERGYPYIVMDYVDGKPLYEWRAKTQPSVRTILTVFKKLALALHEMHRLEIFHRDLKSENVMVRLSDNEPVIIDFGIARPKSAKTVTKMYVLLGTYTHFSPEYCLYARSEDCFAGRPFVNRPTAELWSVGLMLYESLTGRSAFGSHENEGDMAEAILRHQPTAPSIVNPKLPGAVDEAVMALLEKDPARRTQSGTALAEALDSILERSDENWDVPLGVPPRPSRVEHSTAAGRRAPRVASGEIAPAEPPSALVLDAPGPGSSALPFAATAQRVAPLSEVAPPAQKPAASSSNGGFNAPTGGGAAFVPPEGVAAPEQSSAAETNSIKVPTAIREHAAQLRERVGGSGSVRSTPLLVGGGLALAVVAVLALASIGDGNAPVEPKSLLAEVESGERGAPAPVEGPPQKIAAPVSAPFDASENVQTNVVVKPSPASASSSSSGRDAADIAAELEREFGRPTVSKSGQITDGSAKGDTSSPPQPSGPAWLKTGRAQPTTSAQTGGEPEGEERVRKLGVPLGSHIKARLLTNLDSRTVSDGPVEAVLVRPHVVSGTAVLPSRTMIYGQAATSNGRFTITFSRLKLPDHSSFVIDGLAQDAEERKPGLSASRTVAGKSTDEAVGTQVAKGAAGVLLNTVTGGTGQDVVRGAGQTVLSQPAQSNNAQNVILLDAGVDFVVFVRQAF